MITRAIPSPIPFTVRRVPDATISPISSVIPSTARDALWNARDLNGLAPWSSSRVPISSSMDMMSLLVMI